MEGQEKPRLGTGQDLEMSRRVSSCLFFNFLCLHFSGVVVVRIGSHWNPLSGVVDLESYAVIGGGALFFFFFFSRGGVC